MNLYCVSIEIQIDATGYERVRVVWQTLHGEYPTRAEMVSGDPAEKDRLLALRVGEEYAVSINALTAVHSAVPR